ncbi:MAG: hypothetical protein HZA50_17410 [Planctomycetes bacterium]|nr:hypothetical protein [Planctomycetota bacterium]
MAHNRRVVMRDGTVKTHGTFDDPASLCFEGPIDPEVAVLAARTPDGQPLGAIVNFACHPTHHGGTKELSAGYPGVLANEMKARGWPVTLFLNGPCGNMHHNDPADHGRTLTKEQIGAKLAEDAAAIIKDMKFRGQARLWSASDTIDLPFRKYSKEEIAGTIRGAQRFVDPAAYDRGMDALIRKIEARKVQKAQVQVLGIDEIALAGIPAEYFVELGLKIKELGRPAHALVVSHANGMVGYVPHAGAFIRGGYETTFTGSSKLAPQAGDMLADCAISLVRKGAGT